MIQTHHDGHAMCAENTIHAVGCVPVPLGTHCRPMILGINFDAGSRKFSRT